MNTAGTVPPTLFPWLSLACTHCTASQVYLRTAGHAGGLSFCGTPVSGPGGRQILLTDPAGNLVELFQPANKATT